jgi:hypothetical protein
MPLTADTGRAGGAIETNAAVEGVCASRAFRTRIALLKAALVCLLRGQQRHVVAPPAVPFVLFCRPTHSRCSSSSDAQAWQSVVGCCQSQRCTVDFFMLCCNNLYHINLSHYNQHQKLLIQDLYWCLLINRNSAAC